MKYTEDTLQRKIVEMQQALIQLKTNQFATSDTWLPYQTYKTVGYANSVNPQQTEDITTTPHYFRITFLQTTPEPALVLFYSLTTGGYEYYGTDYFFGPGWYSVSWDNSKKHSAYTIGEQFSRVSHTTVSEYKFSQSRWNNMRNIRDMQATILVVSTQPGEVILEEIDSETYEKETCYLQNIW